MCSSDLIPSTIVNKRNAYRQEAQADLAKNRGDLEQAEKVLRQRQQALNSTQLRAPMSGIVKHVRITPLGAVLKSGEELMQIVTSDGPLLTEAKVKAAALAFSRDRMSVEEGKCVSARIEFGGRRFINK